MTLICENKRILKIGGFFFGGGAVFSWWMVSRSLNGRYRDSEYTYNWGQSNADQSQENTKPVWVAAGGDTKDAHSNQGFMCFFTVMWNVSFLKYFLLS